MFAYSLLSYLLKNKAGGAASLAKPQKEGGGQKQNKSLIGRIETCHAPVRVIGTIREGQGGYCGGGI